MPAMISEVYDALKEAGASEEKARAAAEVMAESQSVIRQLSSDIRALKWTTNIMVAVLMSGFTLGISILWSMVGHVSAIEKGQAELRLEIHELRKDLTKQKSP